MSEAEDLLRDADEELEKAARLIREAQRVILRRFRAKRKKEGRCQDCGVKIGQFSRCRSCRLKRNTQKRLRRSA